MCDKKTKTGFLKGRFGLELADFSTFDVDPSSTLGYMLQDWTWVRVRIRVRVRVRVRVRCVSPGYDPTA
jgi:hypothetical protein